MIYKPIKIDEGNRRDHYYLKEEDSCYFFGELISRGGFNASPTNKLISNFKKSVLKRGKPEYMYKEQAIDKVASLVRGAFNPGAKPTLTIVPVPPSKTRNHPEYDDRLTLALSKIGEGWDVRELIIARDSMRAHHEYGGEKRPTPDELYEKLMVDENCLSQKPVQQEIVLFDDVLTAGAHFKACKRLLQERFKGCNVTGLFIARTIHPCPVWLLDDEDE